MSGKAFDAGEYRRTVLSKLKSDPTLADPERGDVMWVCAVDADATPAQAAARLDEVLAQWRKDLSNPKYKGVVAALIKNHDAYAAVLANPAARTAAAERREAERAARFGHALAELEALSKDLVKKRGGIPADRVAMLRSVAEQEGMDAEAFAAWLASKTVLQDERGSGAMPWEPVVRKQVRERLAEIARLDPSTAGRAHTLLTFLGVAPTASVAQVQAAHTRLSEANLRRARDRAMTVTSELLAFVSGRMLTEEGIESYVASLHADAREEIRGPLRRAAIVTGAIDAAASQALVMTVVGLQWGISQQTAQEIVTDAAHALNVPIEVSGDLQVVVCGACGRPQSPGRRRNCQYCNQPLFTQCPQCSTKVESATVICPSCGCNLRLHAAAEQATARARELLDSAQPSQALQTGLEAIGGADVADAPPALRAVLTEAERTIADAVKQWGQLKSEWDRSRPWQAEQVATWLSRNAADVTEPGTGRTIASATAAIAEAQQQVLGAVAQVSGDPERAESELTTLAARFPDAPPVIAALAKLPLAPPRDVQAVLDRGAVDVTWAPAPTRGVSYRVERHVTFPPEARASHVVGTTSATSLEDAGIPIGVQARYTVIAQVDGRTSPAAASPEPGVFLEGDLDAATLEVTGGHVVLAWPAAQLGAARVVVEREVDPTSGVTQPVRRLIPHEEGRVVDDRVETGIPFIYRVFLRYTRPDGTPVNTTGRRLTVTVTPPPQQVRELWCTSTDERGTTTISFSTVTAGEVTLYEGGTGWPAEGTTLTRAELEQLVSRSGARAVGSGRRRVADSAARGAVRYRAVTLSGDQAVIGASLDHVVIPKASAVRVVSDTGSEVKIGVDLPTGVTEVFLAWRRDGEFPRDADTPSRDGAGSTRVTNTKLDIDGGITIAADDDGRPLHVVAFSAMRVNGEVHAAATGPSIVARQARNIQVSYTVEVTGLLRKKVEVNARTSDQLPLPPLEVVAVSGSGGRKRLTTYDGRAWATQLEAPMDPFGNDQPWTIELQATVPAGLQVEVTGPAEAERLIRP